MITTVQDDIASIAMDINKSTVSFLKTDHKCVDQSLPRDIELLHRRFGHADVSMIKRMIAYGSATGLEVSQTSASPHSFHCEACALSKAFQKKRIKNKRKVDGPLHSNRNLYFVAVYSDVLGPILPAAVGGYEYGVTFTEAETRYRFFYPLRKKSDVLTVFQQLVSELSAQGFTVRGLKTDNGGEYCSDEFVQFTTSHNIIHRKTPPNTPQANSLSERYNRVLGERSRAMLSVTPKYLWAESMKTTTYVYNRSLSPSDPTATRTPFELLYGIVPDVSNLRVFGCIAYMYNFDTSKSKLDDRAIKGTFVGYDSTSSAYLIYIHETKTVRRSGHVSFNEHAYFFSPALKLAEDTAAISQSKASRVRVREANRLGKQLAAPTLPQPAVIGIPSLPAGAPVTVPPVSDVTVPSTADPVGKKRPRPQVPIASSSLKRHDHTAVTTVPSVVSAVPAMTSGVPAVDPGVHILSSDKLGPDSATLSRSQLRRAARKRQPPERFRKPDHVYFTGDEDPDFNVDDLIAAALADPVISSILNDLKDVPTSYKNIAKRKDSQAWYDAVTAENNSILKHGVLVPVDQVPLLKNIIKARYVFTRKSDGRYKARLVAKGFTQVYGVDYTDVFAPVVSKNSLRALLSLAAVEDWEIHQVDVETAFLNATLEEDLYMEAPLGFGYPPGSVFKLHKSLYGLKQAPRVWNKALNDWLVSRDFKQNVIDTSVYSRGSGSSAIHLAVYVDDILIFGHDKEFISSFKLALHAQFAIKDMGEVKQILGMLVTRDRVKRTISLSQTDYLIRLVKQFGLDPGKIYSSKPVPISKAAVKTVVSTVNGMGSGAPIEPNIPFRSLLGGLNYACTCSRPDISFAVSSLASHCVDPRKMHWQALVDLLRYISDTKDIAITYGGPLIPGSSVNQVQLFADADFSRNPDIKKSRSGFVIFLNGGAIAWKSKLQTRIAMSTTEAELYAMYAGVEQVLWFREFLGQLGFPQGSVPCHEDNSGLIHWITNHSSNSNMLSIPAQYYRLRSDRDSGACHFLHVITQLQRADLFTKQMDFSVFIQQFNMLFNIV